MLVKLNFRKSKTTQWTILCALYLIFATGILKAQVYNYNFELIEELHSDELSIFQGSYKFEINQQNKSISISKKYVENTKTTSENIELTYRKSKDTIVGNKAFKLYLIFGDPDMVYQSDLEYKLLVSQAKLYYFNEYSFTSFGYSKEDLPVSYMLRDNRQLTKMDRTPSSFVMNKDYPKIRTKEEVLRDENSRSPLEKELGCNKVYPLQLGRAIENLGIFLIEHNDPKEKQDHEKWIKKEIDLLKRTGKLVINCGLIPGNNFQISNNNGYKSITWTDSITKSHFYSNSAFKQLDYATDPYYGGSSIYNFDGGAITPNYNLNWQLIKSNDDQSYRVFRNCYLSYIIEIEKAGDNSHISLTLSQIPEMKRNQTGYFSDCKNADEKTIYRAAYWADVKGKNDWAKAMEQPIMEKVEIIKSNEVIKVTFGTKTYKYIIVSEKKVSEVSVQYLVTLDNKKYTINIMDLSKSEFTNSRTNGTHTINIEGVWMVPEIRDVTTKQGD